MLKGANARITIWFRYNNKFYRYNHPELCRYTMATQDRRRISANTNTHVSELSIRVPYTDNFVLPHRMELPYTETDIDEEDYEYPAFPTCPDKPLGYLLDVDDLEYKPFTIQIGDYIGIGDFDIDIGNEEGQLQPTKLKTKYKEQVIQVTGVHYSIEAALGKHIKIVGV